MFNETMEGDGSRCEREAYTWIPVRATSMHTQYMSKLKTNSTVRVKMVKMQTLILSFMLVKSVWKKKTILLHKQILWVNKIKL